MSKKLADKFIIGIGKKVNEPDYVALKDLLNPNFGYLPVYTKFRFGEKVSLKRIGDLNNLVKRYKQLMNNQKINPLSYKKFETLDDDVNKAIIRNDNIKFAKSFISNKYKKLLSDEVIDLFGELKKKESSHDKVQKYLANKMAAYKNPEELADAINKVIESLTGKWDSETQSIKIEMEGGRIAYKSKDYVVAKIPNYKVSNKLGSANWCISRSPSYWSSYVNNHGIQYFIWNFKKRVGNQHSLIGVTVDVNGFVTAAHDKQDVELDYSSFSYSYGGYGSSLDKVLPKVVTDNFRGPEKEDFIYMVENGYKPSLRIINKYDFSNKYLLELNPYIFTSDKDFMEGLKSGKRDVKEFGTFLKTRKSGINTSDYRNVIKDLDYKEIDSLLGIKFTVSEEILKKVSDSGNLGMFLNKYGDKIKGANATTLKSFVLSKYLDGLISLDDLKGYNLKWSSFQLKKFLLGKSMTIKSLGDIWRNKITDLFKDENIKLGLADSWEYNDYLIWLRNATFARSGRKGLTNRPSLMNNELIVYALLSSTYSVTSADVKLFMGSDFIKDNIEYINKYFDLRKHSHFLDNFFRALDKKDREVFLKLNYDRFPRYKFKVKARYQRRDTVYIHPTFFNILPSLLADKKFDVIKLYLDRYGESLFYSNLRKYRKINKNWDLLLEFIIDLVGNKKSHRALFITNMRDEISSRMSNDEVFKLLKDLNYKTIPNGLGYLVSRLKVDQTDTTQTQSGTKQTTQTQILKNVFDMDRIKDMMKSIGY